MSYGEPGRDFERAGDESGLDSVNSDASEREVLVEAASSGRGCEPRDGFRVLFAQCEKFSGFVHAFALPFFRYFSSLTGFDCLLVLKSETETVVIGEAIWAPSSGPFTLGRFV